MKRIHATRVTVALIVVVLIWHYIEKRNDLRCYVMQRASIHEFVFSAGYASEDEIRDIVWNDTKTEFYGQAWRVSLDNVFHAIFMGGSRGQQVVAHLTRPSDDLRDFSCQGTIRWSIWNVLDNTFHRDYSGTDLVKVHHVTIALQALEQNELRKYSVEVDLISYRDVYSEHGSTYIAHYRDGGEVSAHDWLDGKVVPEYWSGWYAAWLEQGQEFQATEDNE